MAEADISTKICAKCKSSLPYSMFNRNKSKKDGFGTECRPCANAHSRKYHKENHAEHLERGRTAYLNDPEKFKSRARKWEINNADRKRELRARYREANREKIKEFSRVDWVKHNEKRRAAKKAYRQANPERGAEQVRARQTRKQQAMPQWADRDAIRAIYEECSRISKETGVKHHVDHYYPLQNELVCGLHCKYNLRIITAFDNLSKGNSFPSED